MVGADSQKHTTTDLSPTHEGFAFQFLRNPFKFHLTEINHGNQSETTSKEIQILMTNKS